MFIVSYYGTTDIYSVSVTFPIVTGLHDSTPSPV